MPEQPVRFQQPEVRSRQVVLIRQGSSVNPVRVLADSPQPGFPPGPRSFPTLPERSLLAGQLHQSKQQDYWLVPLLLAEHCPVQGLRSNLQELHSQPARLHLDQWQSGSRRRQLLLAARQRQHLLQPDPVGCRDRFLRRRQRPSDLRL